MNQKPQTLKGFRDFLPQEKWQRDFVAKKLTEVFANFGFSQLETPTLEYASLLLGKYGAEADKLVYTFEDKGGRNVGLRYDQTVPTARVLAQYQNDLPRYFRRYQMQNVFRADKPQKGRFREFTQCDCDIFGSTSLAADLEIITVLYKAIMNIGFPQLEIQLNDREILINALTSFSTPEVSVFSIIQSLDKLDKQTEESVCAELTAKGILESVSTQIVANIKTLEKSDKIRFIEQYCDSAGIPKSALKFNPFLARGLDYYTGIIFEVRVPEYTVGSVGGGGRYDNLINELTGQQMPAVGFGIGFDRVVEAALEANLIPQNAGGPQALVTVFNENTFSYSVALATELRASGISTELYPSFDQLGKQFKLANQKLIPLVLTMGDDEVSANTVVVKDMLSGEQQSVARDSVVAYILSVIK